MITLNDIYLTLRRKNVRNGVTIELHAGLTAIVGENGAGKTSLLKVLLGLYKPDSGTAEGWPIRNSRQVVGYCPQEFELPGRVRVGNFLAYAGWLKGLETQAMDAQIDRSLEIVGLRDRKWERLADLSGGMRRRVGIAQALIADPDVVVLDEPTSGLDPAQRLRVRGVLRDLPPSTIAIMSTQLVEDAVLASDRVLVLNRGRVTHDLKQDDLSVDVLERILSSEERE